MRGRLCNGMALGPSRAFEPRSLRRICLYLTIEFFNGPLGIGSLGQLSTKMTPQAASGRVSLPREPGGVRRIHRLRASDR